MSETGDVTATDDDLDAHYFFKVRLMLTHPSLHPDVMSARLDLTPHSSFMAGEPRMTPRGTLMGGVNAVSYWSRSERYERSRRLFDPCMDVIAHLEGHAKFVEEMISTGGTVMVEVDMPGTINIGDVIGAEDLARFIRLGVKLGIEVFPGMQ